MIQENVWLLTLFGMGFVALAFGWVALRASSTGDGARVKAVFYGVRPWWFALLVLIIFVALAATLGRLPYADTHGRADAPAELVVEVTGHQWYWALSQTEFPAGQEIAFHVTAADVNHSFALYDEQDRLLVQTQAMPGYTNVVRHTFDRPGTYRLLCLEYCGLAHHAMMTDLTVTERP